MVCAALVKRLVQSGISSSKHGRRLISSFSQIPPNGQKAEDRVLQIRRKDFDPWKYDSALPDEFIPPAAESEKYIKKMLKDIDAKRAKLFADVDKSGAELEQAFAQLKYEMDQTYKIFSRCFVGTAALVGLVAGFAIPKRDV